MIIWCTFEFMLAAEMGGRQIIKIDVILIQYFASQTFYETASTPAQQKEVSGYSDIIVPFF